MSDLPFGLLHPVVGGVVERVAGVGDGEVDEGRDAAARAGAGAGAVVVGGDGAAERQLEVDVHVEHAGDDVVAGGVDRRRARARRASEPNAAIFSPAMPDVADERPARGDDVAAFDDRVEFHASRLLSRSERALHAQS